MKKESLKQTVRKAARPLCGTGGDSFFVLTGKFRTGGGKLAETMFIRKGSQMELRQNLLVSGPVRSGNATSEQMSSCTVKDHEQGMAILVLFYREQIRTNPSRNPAS